MGHLRLTVRAASLICLPFAAAAQDGPTPLVPQGLFSANERPSVAARTQGLSNPSRDLRAQRSIPKRLPAETPEEASDNDLEFGVEGYVWAGFSMKL
jgi:hypothetical protein